jgi:hypothetical protein
MAIVAVAAVLLVIVNEVTVIPCPKLALVVL